MEACEAFNGGNASLCCNQGSEVNYDLIGTNTVYTWRYVRIFSSPPGQAQSITDSSVSAPTAPISCAVNSNTDSVFTSFTWD
jgi:hypothetical protein